MTDQDRHPLFSQTNNGMAFKWEATHGWILNAVTDAGNGVGFHGSEADAIVNIALWRSEEDWDMRRLASALIINPSQDQCPGTSNWTINVSLNKFQTIVDYLTATDEPGLGQIIALLERGPLTIDA